jgi:hypothetical protein
MTWGTGWNASAWTDVSGSCTIRITSPTLAAHTGIRNIKIFISMMRTTWYPPTRCGHGGRLQRHRASRTAGRRRAVGTRTIRDLC